MQLRDYQEQISADAAKLLAVTKIAYLSMQVRTGKTLTALATAEKYGATSVLFLTKKKAISSIQEDFDALNPPFVIDILNYEQLPNIIDRAVSYDLVICDEAHGLGQFPTPAERAKLLRRLCVDLPVIYLSGTPTPESYSQLYHQFYISSFSPFKVYTNFYKWAKDFVTVKKKYYFNREMNDYSCANKAAIDEATRHLFISYTQEEAGFTEDVQEEVVLLRMQPTTYTLVRRLISDRVYIGKAGEEILADTAVKLQNKLHQMFSGTVICEDKTAICFDHSKASFIKEKFAGKKIAIFYKFQAERIMLIAAFGYDRLTEDPMEFNLSADKIFFSQIQSGSMGINLSTAWAIIMLNIDFSNVQYWQVRARMQDKDRSIPARLYWIFAENGIEQKILEVVRNKADYVLSYFKKDFNIKNHDQLA